MGSTHGGRAYLSHFSVSIESQLHYQDIPRRLNVVSDHRGCLAAFIRMCDPCIGRYSSLPPPLAPRKLEGRLLSRPIYTWSKINDIGNVVRASLSLATTRSARDRRH